MRQLELFSIGTRAFPQAQIRDRPAYACWAEVANRFFWDNGNLPYVFCNVTYVSLLELIAMKNKRFNKQIEFVTLRLTTADKEKFAVWEKANTPKIFKYLNELSEGGYKVSISPDFNNSCIIASITGTENSTANVGLCMTSRAESVEEAIMLACYKHFELCAADDWTALAGKNDDNWG